MDYNFDELIDRRHTHCVKWDVNGNSDRDIIPLWVADMDFKVAQPIIDALHRRVEHGVFGYTCVPEEYYESVINWFDRRHGWRIKREWIQYTSGVVPAISAIIKGLTNVGDKVAVLTPVYNCFFSSIRNNDCEVLEIPLRYDDCCYTIDFEEFDHQTADPSVTLFILCNPHNPAGRVWSHEELARLAEICRRNGVIVISDEIHCEITFKGHDYTPFASIGDDALHNCVTCSSPSKSFNTAGLQISNIVTYNPEWRERIDRALNINETCDVGPFGVEAVMAAYNESEDWLEQMRDYVEQNYLMLCEYFAANMPQYPVTKLEGTYLTWIDCECTGMGSQAITDRLFEQANVLVNAGAMYGEVGNRFIRINIACPKARLLEGLRRITPVMNAMTKAL